MTEAGEQDTCGKGYVTGPLFLWVGEQGLMQYGSSQVASDPHWLGSGE